MAARTDDIPAELSKKSFRTRSLTSKSVVRAPIDRWGYVGIWIRHRLLESIKVGTPVNLVLQEHRTPFCNKIMSMSSFMGTEDFITCLAMFITWIIDARLGRLFTILLALGFYCSSFFKCLLCLPRPPSPPVKPLHREDLDWAFPSNHGIMGVIAPWYICFYCFLHYQMPLPVQLVLFIGILLWSVGVIFSRIYLGVHSPADMVGGGFVGVTILSIYLLVDDYVDYQCAAGRYVIPQAIVIVLGLFALHPRCVPETQSFGETVIVGSCALGCVVARATSTLTMIPAQALMDAAPSDIRFDYFCLLLLARVFVGCFIVFASRLIMKITFRPIFVAIYNYFDLSCYSFSTYLKSHPPTSKHLTLSYKLSPFPGKEKSNECSEDENATKSDEEEINDDEISLPYDIDIPTRLLTYTFLGWFLCEGAFILFHFIGV